MAPTGTDILSVPQRETASTSAKMIPKLRLIKRDSKTLIPTIVLNARKQIRLATIKNATDPSMLFLGFGRRRDRATLNPINAAIGSAIVIVKIETTYSNLSPSLSSNVNNTPNGKKNSPSVNRSEHKMACPKEFLSGDKKRIADNKMIVNTASRTICHTASNNQGKLSVTRPIRMCANLRDNSGFRLVFFRKKLRRLSNDTRSKSIAAMFASAVGIMGKLNYQVPKSLMCTKAWPVRQ